MENASDERARGATYEFGIIGSGPAGLSAAAHAAELGLTHVLFEAEAHPSNTIHKYQKGKHVMAEPQVLPLRSPLRFAAGRREAVLEAWSRGIGEHKVNLRHGAQVTAARGADREVQGETPSGRDFACR